MENKLEYDAFNGGDESIMVCNKDGNEAIGVICPREKFIVLDSWVSNDNKFINAKVKFTNYKGQLAYGYLYDISYVKQISF